MGMQMNNKGTGIYYKPGWVLNDNSQIIGDAGIHINNLAQSMTYHGYRDQNSSLFLELLLGYQKELLKERIVGAFSPVLILQGGGSVDVNKISWAKMGNCIFIYAAGTGFQFYNSSILNELMLKLHQYFSEERKISMQLSIYWK